MESIKLLEAEHQNVLRLCKIIRQMLENVVVDAATLNVEDMNLAIDIIQNYTDAHHHGKEEEILFKYMLDELGGPGEKIVRNGMLVEHEMSRHHVRGWKENLENYESEPKTSYLVAIIGHAFSYADLLENHIEREDGVVYPFAERSLSDEAKQKVEQECREFELKAEEKSTQAHYLKAIDTLEAKYLG